MSTRQAGKKQIPVPRALETGELPDIVGQFRRAAENARDAGFDGVEIHGANGYLLDQFLRSGSNKRTDQYGGSLENRARLPLEVTKAVIGVWGGDRVGYRISPHLDAHSMSDANPRETFSYLTKELNNTGLGYLHLIEAIGGRLGFVPPEARLGPDLRRIFGRTFILNGGYGLRSGNEAIARGEADLIAFGVPFLANPDLPERFRQNAPLNEADVATFYAGEAKGYTDYPRPGLQMRRSKEISINKPGQHEINDRQRDHAQDDQGDGCETDGHVYPQLDDVIQPEDHPVNPFHDVDQRFSIFGRLSLRLLFGVLFQVVEQVVDELVDHQLDEAGEHVESDVCNQEYGYDGDANYQEEVGYEDERDEQIYQPVRVHIRVQWPVEGKIVFTLR